MNKIEFAFTPTTFRSHVHLSYAETQVMQGSADFVIHEHTKSCVLRRRHVRRRTVSVLLYALCQSGLLCPANTEV